MFREIAKGIARNTSIMLFQQAVTWASSFLLMLFLPRMLGPAEYGKLFLAISIVDIFRILVNYGGNYLVAKHVSRGRDRTAQILVDALAFRSVLAVLAVLALVVFVKVIDYPMDTSMTIFIVGAMLLWQGAITALYASYQGHELLKFTSLGAIAERVIISVVGVSALFMGADILTIAAIISFGNFVNFVLLAVFVQRIAPRLPRVNWAEALSQVREGIPYFLFAVFSTIYYRIDSLMLSKMSPDEVVGWYGGAFRLFDVFNFLPYILTVAVYPVLSRLWKESDENHKRTTRKGLEIVIAAGIPIAIGVGLFADRLISLFYGLEGYSSSVIILRVLAAGLIFLYIDMILVTTLLACDRQKQFAMVSLSAIPVKLLLNYFLIGYFQSTDGNGGIGAAIATGLTEVGIMAATITMMPGGILSNFRFSVVGKSLLAGALMLCVLLALSYFGIPWAAQIPIGATVYAVAIFTLHTLDPAEEDLIRRLIASRSIGRAREILGMQSNHPHDTV